jgi:hypothetical protein
MKHGTKNTRRTPKTQQERINEQLKEFGDTLKEIKPFLKPKMQRVRSDRQPWGAVQTTKI